MATPSQDAEALMSIAEEAGFKKGWVLHQLEKTHNFSEITKEEWQDIAEVMEYSPGWAYYKYEEYSSASEVEA